MKRFGVREICDVVLRAKAKQTLGSRTFYKNEPVLYFDTLKTSSLEGAATTVYAQGGRGNPRLIAWEGERTLTFTMEDALLSAESFAILSGAGLIAATAEKPIYVHSTSQVEATADNTFVLPAEACWNGGRAANLNEAPAGATYDFHKEADIFCMKLDENGEIAVEPCVPAEVDVADGKTTIKCIAGDAAHQVKKGDIILVDYYVKKTGAAQMIEITPDKFGGNYYLEASTLFRRESDGVDMPAEFVIPNCKVQSNFTFSMASSGDPSTFTFTIDAFPDYTKFDRTHKVLAAIQVIEDESSETIDWRDACGPFDEAVTVGTDTVTAKVEKDTATEYAVRLSGSAVQQGTIDAATFPGITATDKVVELDMALDMVQGDQYTIVQNNPALELFFPADTRISKVGDEYIKTQTITAPAPTEKFQMLVKDGTSKATVKVYKGSSASGKPVRTYTVNANLTFA